MECPECRRLKAERAARELDYTMTILRMNAAACDGSGTYMILKTLADEAGLDLRLTDTEIAQHQDRHAVAN
jgi:hypothetical protein